MGRLGLRAGVCAARGFPVPISDASWHPRFWPCVHAGARWRGRCQAVLLGGLDEALDLAIGEIFTAALANCYIYAVGAASRSREFSMETALPPVRSPAPPDIAEELGGS